MSAKLSLCVSDEFISKRMRRGEASYAMADVHDDPLEDDITAALLIAAESRHLEGQDEHGERDGFSSTDDEHLRLRKLVAIQRFGDAGGDLSHHGTMVACVS